MDAMSELREEKTELEAEAGGAGKDPKYVPTYAPEPVFGLSSDHLHPSRYFDPAIHTHVMVQRWGAGGRFLGEQPDASRAFALLPEACVTDCLAAAVTCASGQQLLVVDGRSGYR